MLSTWGVSTLFGRITGCKRLFGVIGFVLYEGVGVIRLVTGLQAGMSKFGFLVGMMVIGVILFALTQAAGWHVIKKEEGWLRRRRARERR